MTIRPNSIDDLSRKLAEVSVSRTRISSVDLSALRRVLEHTPEDMTATVEAGITFGALQQQLGQFGQWLPLDPPNADHLTVHDLLAQNVSGPRRFGYGTVRDYLIGLRVALADGRIIKSGGKVVKNVAGYDLAKLFIGSRGTLGVIVEATFKLRPLPEEEKFVQTRCCSLDEAEGLLESVLTSETSPVLVDLHDQRSRETGDQPSLVAVIGFAGTTEDVQHELEKMRELGIEAPASLEYERSFWPGAVSNEVQRVSVLPSDLCRTLRDLRAESFVARAGNGIIHYRGGKALPKEHLALPLMQRVKGAFDPNHILPDLPR